MKRILRDAILIYLAIMGFVAFAGGLSYIYIYGSTILCYSITAVLTFGFCFLGSYMVHTDNVETE